MEDADGACGQRSGIRLSASTVTKMEALYEAVEALNRVKDGCHDLRETASLLSNEFEEWVRVGDSANDTCQEGKRSLSPEQIGDSTLGWKLEQFMRQSKSDFVHCICSVSHLFLPASPSSMLDIYGIGGDSSEAQQTQNERAEERLSDSLSSTKDDEASSLAVHPLWENFDEFSEVRMDVLYS